MTTITEQRFLVGTVISQTFTAFFTRILPFGGLAFIGFIPTLIFLGAYFYFVFYYLEFPTFPTPGEPVQPPFEPGDWENLPWPWIIAGVAVFYLASIATTAIWLAATSYAAFQYLRNQPVRFWGSLQRGISVVLPCLGVIFLIALVLLPFIIFLIWPFIGLDESADVSEILSTIGLFMLGMLVFLAVAAFVACRMWVAIPAIAVERPGVIAALRRSWQLTQGHAWRVFGIILVMWAGTMGASVAAGIVVFVAIIAIGGITGMMVGQGLNILISMLANALYAIAAAVSYVELRRTKEGFGIEDIAAVFD